jgi:tRNA pseudouridine38-40 synthase
LLFQTGILLAYRYFIRISYLGSKYHGWQIQSNAPSVQSFLNEKLSMLIGEAISVTGAGRTDAGVHASCYFVHFDSLQPDLAGNKDLIYHLNAVLPSDIAIYAISPVKPDAHARFSALSRTYEYHLHTLKDPFLEGLSLFYNRPLNMESLQEACYVLKETEDFKSFSKNHSDVQNYLCRIFEAEWTILGHRIIYRVSANRFLRNMVRAMVGTMLDLGTGKISLQEFRQIIQSRSRSMAGKSVPPHGLYLSDIKYPEGIFL